jgi:hypothetical protein
MTIGRASAGTFHFDGEIDEVRVSSVARYTGGVFQKPRTRFAVDEQTVALYHFDDNAMTTPDATGKHGGASVGVARVKAPCIDAR